MTARPLTGRSRPCCAGLPPSILSPSPRAAIGYSVRAARDGHVVELEHGELQVAADIAQLAAGHDPRAHVQKVLDAIEAVLENRATLEQEQYQINNRSLKRRSIGELLKLRDHYRAELSRMNAARRGRLFGNINVAFR